MADFNLKAFSINSTCLILYWLLLPTIHRYAYSEEVGEEFDDEEAQSLTRGKTDGDISLVEKKEKNVGSPGDFDQEDETEEDKREWLPENTFFYQPCSAEQNHSIDLSSKRWLACYCLCNFYPLSDGPSKWSAKVKCHDTILLTLLEKPPSF